MSDHRRSSDRWVTPGVVCTFVVVAGGLVALLIVVVGYLQARGVDPDPMIRLVGEIVTAVGALGTLLLQLVGRRTTTKVERNTGVLATEVAAVADALYQEQPEQPHVVSAPREAPTRLGGIPPVPPARC